jgi:ubiquinone/menaquinone biosynthesis C-methylase UbiE
MPVEPEIQLEDMFTNSAHIYDLVYSFKDYQKESKEIIDAIKQESPESKTLLDIGCGTAEHHKFLKTEYSIEGLDINSEFIEVAKAKNPGLIYHQGDMADFSLNKRYDVVICLFSSIGYVKTFDKLVSTLKRFYGHLYPGGLAIVEPWLTPESWQDRKLHMLTYDKEDLKICRINLGETQNGLSILNFHYLIGDPANGVKHFKERHELALFTKEEMMNAFTESGFDVTYDATGITGRGLYFGKKNP